MGALCDTQQTKVLLGLTKRSSSLKFRYLGQTMLSCSNTALTSKSRFWQPGKSSSWLNERQFPCAEQLWVGFASISISNNLLNPQLLEPRKISEHLALFKLVSNIRMAAYHRQTQCSIAEPTQSLNTSSCTLRGHSLLLHAYPWLLQPSAPPAIKTGFERTQSHWTWPNLHTK